VQLICYFCGSSITVKASTEKHISVTSPDRQQTKKSHRVFSSYPYIFQGTVYFLTESEGGRSKPVLPRYAQKLFMETWDTSFRLDIPDDVDGDMILPGEQSRIKEK
jgi:translation elongation factor EF-Tu-like GTPase